MKSAFEILFFAGIISSSLLYAYWQLLRPILIRALRYEVYAVRDELRMLVIRKKVSESTRGYRPLEECCKRTVSALSEMDMVSMLIFARKQKVTSQAISDLKLVEEAPSELKNIYLKILGMLLVAIVINSPILLLLAPILMVWILVVRKKNAIEKLKTRAWESTYSECFA